jgi:hypothetical protein
MTITIFQKDRLDGRSQTVTGNIRDLRNAPADKPGSIKLTDSDEAVLLFKNDDWHGGALYIRGPKTVNDLGKKSDGGRMGFGNSVRSLRCTPFGIDLNITVVTGHGGKLPGSWANQAAAEVIVRDAVQLANACYDANRALLTMQIARISFRPDPDRFDLSKRENWRMPNEWKDKDEVDFVVVNRIEKEDVVGIGKLPSFGQTVVVSAMGNLSSGADEPMTANDIGRVLAHEVGHYLGLSHGTANGAAKNLMADKHSIHQSIKEMVLTIDQVREMQDRLANHHSRRGDRDD